MTILLVDDEANMRKLMRRLLQSRGLQVFDAGSGAEALGLAELQSIDMLVTDVVMENMDGTALALELTARRPGLPVLFISGMPMDFESERRHYARSAFLRKPFQPQELVEAIQGLAVAAA